MKKLGLLLVAAFSAITFSSCMDTEGDYPQYMNFVTVRTIPNSQDFYFEADNGQTIYPSDKSKAGSYEPEDGKRALIMFNFLTQIEGYNYNIKLYQISNMFTGKARAITTQEELDAIKDDPIGLYGARLTKTYLTLHVLYPVNDNEKHKFEVIINEVKPTITNEGYLDIELRHDNGGETQGSTQGSYISFNLADIQGKLTGMKGISLRTKNNLETKSYKIDFTQE